MVYSIIYTNAYLSKEEALECTCGRGSSPSPLINICLHSPFSIILLVVFYVVFWYFNAVPLICSPRPTCHGLIHSFTGAERSTCGHLSRVLGVCCNVASHSSKAREGLHINANQGAAPTFVHTLTMKFIVSNSLHF